ncbi:MAG: N-succinylarginine dihydrolase, partial [Leptospiraceae bacterium]|nr:N-succinylarginine dihydrolase [Leptospiraceae bacterium]
FTPANLSSHVHRSLEARQTTRVLRAVFHNQDYFRVHDPLPATLSDEGAANAMLLKPDFRCTGLSLLVYGRRLFETTDSRVTSLNPGYAYPARQTYEACESIVRRHNIRPNTALLLQQNTNAIQCGVFHNDVIATGHRHLLLAHEHAFQHPHAMEQIKDAYARQYDAPLYVRLVRDAELSLRASVDSYLFNSQIVSSGEDMLMLAPQECAETPAAHAIIQDMLADEGNPLRECKFVDLRESMQNGGGPACLRLRVEMDECARSAMHGNLILENETQIDTLETWARKHYRDRLHPEDLRDPSLLEESRRALDELGNIMGLTSIYDFQRESTD